MSTLTGENPLAPHRLHALQHETDLEHMREHLRQTQAMLLQQERLASIGQLAAGVAHEINNPISYVKSNLNSLDRYIQVLSQLLEMLLGLRDNAGNPEREAAWREIDRLRLEQDLDFIMIDLPAVIRESMQGVERVRQIVADLKSFSRADESKPLLADVRESITTALNIAWNEIKYRVRVTQSLDEVPQIECYPRQLTQVFVNLLVNAAQAIPESGEVNIRTSLEADRVAVTVSDNGCGISPEHIQHIFDPFFTTKEVGKGTGLGLSIVFTIVQRHGGTISVTSTPGTGTTFKIVLPQLIPVATAQTL